MYITLVAQARTAWRTEAHVSNKYSIVPHKTIVDNRQTKP